MFKSIKTVQDFQKRLLVIFSIVITIILVFLLAKSSNGQVIIGPTSGIYSQDFGTTDITTWTNNSTFTGWYSTHTSITHENITSSAPSNNGGFYSYECNGNNDQKIGSRSSNTVPGPVGNYIRYGVRFLNNSGQTITKIKITYTGYQFSLAENLNTTNSLEFHYRINTSSIIDLTSGTYTSVPALWYVAPNNHSGPGNSNQVLGYPCNVSSVLTECINVTLNNGSEIMLRWSEKNDSYNDHHLGIDDITVEFYPNTTENATTCVSPLPINLLNFEVNKKEQSALIKWTTLSEINNDYFIIERSSDAENFYEIEKVKGAGNSNQPIHYAVKDYNPINGINYYRLKQIDFDGTYTYSETKAVKFENSSLLTLYSFNNSIYIKTDKPLRNVVLEIYDINGRSVYFKNINDDTNINVTTLNYVLENGTYIAKVKTDDDYKICKFIISN